MKQQSGFSNALMRYFSQKSKKKAAVKEVELRSPGEKQQEYEDGEEEPRDADRGEDYIPTVAMILVASFDDAKFVR
ncbi:hypothetical protein NDN08_005131 [Rhodosorus marinus]|uniref:Uncharacterized protein n=1 Tax=Rhodosorus marinus TaxID=101924 RepID=A0AAV8V435_9RHOD|nr:hypothetical protein NDN08_005131 [Rhodosorus marinus]